LFWGLFIAKLAQNYLGKCKKWLKIKLFRRRYIKNETRNRSFNAYEDLLYEERKACKIKLFGALVKLPYFTKTKINEKQLQIVTSVLRDSNAK